ncbi:MarR family winged helix-turn-helix transcriptional regulator [Pseudonocardia sp.]|uniref:MarR family winged helix-turn-helix transcriptional regulator n=1 Tax=Pseudonocardia sp. TaxID=60912 RepID=UPI003D11871C
MAETGADLDRRLAEATERLGDAARSMLRRAAAAEGMSPTQAQLLLRITSSGTRDRGTGSLAGWLAVSAPTVSDALAALTDKGLVERSAPRVWTATARGREAAGRITRWRDPVLAALHALPVAAKAQSLTVLLNVIVELNAAGIISTARTCLSCRFYQPHPPDDGWCALLEQTLAPAALRVDCAEHVPAGAQQPARQPPSAHRYPETSG